MNISKMLRASLCLVLALSMLLSVGVSAFAAVESPAVATKAADPVGDYGSTKVIYTGSDTTDDKFSIRLDAYQNSSSSTTSTGTPLDITIVFDRSQSMSQPASTSASDYKTFKSVYPGDVVQYNSSYGWYDYNLSKVTVSSAMQAEIDKINTYLNSLNKDAYEGYYRATNYLKRGVPYFKNNHDGFAAQGFASWEPLRYNKTSKRWEMRVTNGLWGGDFPGGINTMDFTTGSIANKQVKWVSVIDAYKNTAAVTAETSIPKSRSSPAR